LALYLILHQKKKLGLKGKLTVQDIAPIQVKSCTYKLRNFPQCSVIHADAQSPKGDNYDAITSFFLLHEVPEDYKQNIVNSSLSKVKRGGKVVFIDYHKPSYWHPLRHFMTFILVTLEPFATSLWNNEIASFVKPEIVKNFEWKKETYFGGLYQKVVATRVK
jgi:ubiquinone/menaquinone biosynthesis C-methylase UbiE